MSQSRLTRPVDESMDLLNDIVRNPVDPDYEVVAGRQATRPRPWVLGVVMLGFGLMVGVSLGNTMRVAPQAQAERADLVARVGAASGRVADLQQQRAELARENQNLANSVNRIDPSTAAELDRLASVTGSGAVRGPGVVAVVDDGEADDQQGRVVDADLRQLVNQLWRSGAEAIAINGHRLSSRTAIRGAGDAITVDYRSLTRPYRVEAVGDADAMISEFPGSSGGQWWAYLQQNYGVGFELTRSADLTLAGDPGLGIDLAGVR
ncbi:MAG: DUF881 domain-containing protein [Propionibacteriaceae bacterium]|nr:DUF881 domain-containing protein [Propionibacteriaceae bacterium]